jgi:hypothetical protein
MSGVKEVIVVGEMKIDEVFSEAFNVMRARIRRDGSARVKNLVIYMSETYWQECMTEISGAVCDRASEFFHSNKVCGIPVFIARYPIGNSKSHQNFRLVEII